MTSGFESEIRADTSTSQPKPAHENQGYTFVRPGKYSLGLKDRKLVERFDRGVLELWFSVCDPGPFFGLQLPRYYNVTVSPGRRTFHARAGSSFVREYCALFAQRPKFDCDPLARFENILVEGVVGQVKRDYRQRLICKEARYSTVRELIRTL